jgi:hypothetical protein
MNRSVRDLRASWGDAPAEPDVLAPLRARFSLFEAGRPRAVVAGGIAVLICGALLIPSVKAPVSEMDEGAVLAYGQLVNEGDLPGQDFETFYGPGEPWATAAAFDIASPSVGIERAMGFASRLIILSAILVLALRWGLLPAVSAAAVSSLAMYPVGIGSYALWSALALGLGGLALLSRSSSGTETGTAEERARGAPALAAAGGISSGLAVLFYVAAAPAVVLASLPLIVRARRRLRLAYAAGFLVALIPTAVWLALLGPHGISQLVGDLAASRPGRHLPLPRLGTAEGQVLLATLLATGCMLVSGALLLWRSPSRADRGAILLALGLFSLALLPQLFQRADTGHVVSVGCVALAGAPLLLAEAISISPGRVVTAARRNWLIGAAGVLSVVAAAAVVHLSAPLVRDDTLGRTTAYDVGIDGRSVPIRSEGAAADLNAILPRLAQVSKPGDSVFVGPQDLRRTNYADTFVYFLMPQLRPASFFTEVNPGATNSSDSGLADDLRTADYLVLTSRWNAWDEPNASSDYGSEAPNRVVQSEFSPIAREGSYLLYAHNEPQAGS